LVLVREAVAKANVAAIKKVTLTTVKMLKDLVAATKKAMLTKMQKARVVVTRTQKVLVAATKRAMLKIKALKASAAKVSAADLFKIPTISLSQKAHGKPWAFFCLLQALSFRNSKFRSLRLMQVAAMLVMQP
jgi:hypothetical protein